MSSSVRIIIPNIWKVIQNSMVPVTTNQMGISHSWIIESYRIYHLPHENGGQIHLGLTWQCVKTLYPFCSHQNSW